MKHLRGLHKAIRYFGSQENFAKALGVSRPSISHWLNGVRNLPDFLAIKIFFLTQGSISLDELGHDHKMIYKLAESIVAYTKNPATQIPLKEIQIGRNHCPIYKTNEHKNLDLKAIDIYKPILVDENNYLIACECRLRANFLLGRRYIHVHKLNLLDVINGQVSIAMLVEALPISEKVAIGLSIERELGNRRGQRTDLPSLNNYSENNLSRKCNRQKNSELRDKYPLVIPGTKSRELAAKIAGFNSDFAYRQAKIVNEKGLPALILAMDNNLCPISKAGQIASLSFEEQNLFLISNSKLSTTKRET